MRPESPAFHGFVSARAALWWQACRLHLKNFVQPTRLPLQQSDVAKAARAREKSRETRFQAKGCPIGNWENFDPPRRGRDKKRKAVLPKLPARCGKWALPKGQHRRHKENGERSCSNWSSTTLARPIRPRAQSGLWRSPSRFQLG